MIRGRNRQASLETRRVPFDSQVTLELGGGQKLLARTTNLSPGGFFAATPAPGRAGLTAAFELHVATGWRTISGQARVAWSRAKAEGPDRPAGMGVMITEIDERGQRLLRWIVAHYLRTGAPLEGEEPVLGSEASARPTRPARNDDVAFPSFISASRPVELPAPAGRRAVRWWLVAAVTIVLLGGLAGAFFEPGEIETAATATGVTGSAPGEQGLPVAGVELSEATAVSVSNTEPAEIESAADESIARAVASWAGAWADQRTEDYLAFYSPEFVPEGGASREAWSRERRERLTSPAFIEVSIEALEIEEEGPDGASARFRQSYRSDSYADEVDKILVWTREPGGWRILAESVAD
jgi:hypothetical protein